MNLKYESVEVLGVRIALVKLEQILTIINDLVRENGKFFITHTNVSGLLLAYENKWYRDILNSSDFVFCDGMGVILGARLLGYNIPQRFTLADWMYPLADLANRSGYSFFFLGNPPGVAQNAAKKMEILYPGLQIAGAEHGFFDKTPGSQENKAIIEAINRVEPDILLVGFGMPLQEQWLVENLPYLNVKVSITCGALFEYLSGDLPRGPRWMTDHYLEWLARMIISPRRYYGRYLRDIPLFFYRILRQKYFHSIPT
jgi:N-acetylglucosaminyldiphosphoundecaprenol N-acetyl-beta-D-mannosaminyltransferase